LQQGETKKTFFSGWPRLVWSCPSCSAAFVQKPEAPDRYELKSAGPSVTAIVQKYRKQALTTAEWQRIAAGGASDAEIASADLETFLNTVRDGSTVLTRGAEDSPVALKRGEDFVLTCPDVVMREPRTVTQGVYGGPRIRVAKNLSFNLGGFRAAPHEELRDVDTGNVVVTTKRFVFMGSKRTVSVNLTQIVDVEPYQDAVAIHRSNKQRTEMFCNLDRYGFEFNVEGRSHMASLSGGVLACIIEGLITAGEAATLPTRQRASAAGSKGADPRGIADELAKLAKLRDSGVLTDAEFAKLKAELIG